MKCPFCGHLEDRVIDSRPSEDNSAIRRRRECLACKKRFTTFEKLEKLRLLVVKRDGGLQPFDREKLMTSIMKSCAKRPIASQRIEELVDRLEQEAIRQYQREISSDQLGELVLKYLRDLDEVAYIRFASVYKAFDDIDSFVREINRIRSEAHDKQSH